MKFDINDYKGKYVMHCKTEEEAIDFCNYLHSVGKTWYMGDSYLTKHNYHHFKENTTYNFNEGLFSSVSWYKNDDYIILEWSDFMNKKFTKADLKTGDVVMHRNGKIHIVNRELEMLIGKDGWTDLDNMSDNLSYPNSNWDIIAIRRPVVKGDCQFIAFKYEFGTLVYERKEVEEMTLAEVCRELGREIKIVK